MGPDASEQLQLLWPSVYRGIDLAGVFLNGIIGGQLARARGFDPVGFIVLAILSALGGGMIRDVLISPDPPVALTDPYYLGTAIAGACAAMLMHFSSGPVKRLMSIADGLVLGCWAATGVAKTLANGFGLVPAILMGITTAIGGGMLRDICAGMVPRVLGGNTLYATPAATSALIMALFYGAEMPITGMIAATLVGAVFTVLSERYEMRLPQGNWDIMLSASNAKKHLQSATGKVRFTGILGRNRRQEFCDEAVSNSESQP